MEDEDQPPSLFRVFADHVHTAYIRPLNYPSSVCTEKTWIRLGMSDLSQCLVFQSFFSSPEPKAHRCAISITMVRRPSVVHLRPSSVHNAQTSSSQKPLGRSKPNFMLSLLG